MSTLLTAQNCEGNIHLVIGSGPLAASRCAKVIAAGARPVLVAPEAESLHFTLTRLVETGGVTWVKRSFEDADLTMLGREEVDHVVDAVFVTLGPTHATSLHISKLCKRLRIPVNVVDSGTLSTFTLLSTYSDGPLQIGITTSGRGCRLASRIRREIANTLPQNLGVAIDKLGTMRKRVWEEDKLAQTIEAEMDEEDLDNQKHTFNALVKENDTDGDTHRTRRMRWLTQICEYWPLKRLAAISDEDIEAILHAYRRSSRSHSTSDRPDLSELRSPKGTITLCGAGPGRADCLTVAAYQAIKSADYILADKLVPAEVLELIPRRTPVHIARKFPGNADAAQDEMHELALRALNEGKNVLRLKQGEIFLFGRGGEEVIFFRKHGHEARLIPGITSSLSAPLFAGIPVTHRSVADQVVICTGTGTKGAAPEPPAYQSSKTVVFLMALHRLESLVASLTETDRAATAWPANTPCAVIERASCPDQRVIRTTLEHVCQAVVESGSRPPGLLVVGWACQVLHQPVGGLDWVVEDGLKDESVVDDPNLRDLALLPPPFAKVPLPDSGLKVVDTVACTA